LMVGEEGYAIQ